MRRGTRAAVAATLAALAIPDRCGAPRARSPRSAATSPIRPCACIRGRTTFTKRDRTSETGRRLQLKLASMPKNKDGKPINPRT